MPLKVNADGTMPMKRDAMDRPYVDPAFESTLTSGNGGGPAFPVGSLFLSAVSTNPATLLGYGTWAAYAEGLLLIGRSSTDGTYGTVGAQVGSATHGHTVTQPSDHAALTHTGAGVSDHTVTQPSAHSAHVFTQPGNHSAHVVTQPGAHADNIAHTHGLQGTGGTTLATTGTFLATASAAGGSLRTATGPSLSQGTGSSLAHTGAAVDAHSAHSGGAVDAHSAHAGTGVSAHSVTQPGSHGTQSHTGAAVATAATLPPSVVVYVWQRTA